MYLSKFPKMKNSNNLTPKEIDTLREIRSGLRNLGKFPSVRELMVVMGYRSPRSVSVLLQKLEEKGFLQRDFCGNLQVVEESNVFKNNVFLVSALDIPGSPKVPRGTRASCNAISIS